MKLGVVGSRAFINETNAYKGFLDKMDKYVDDQVTEIVSGGAKGVDGWADNYGREYDIPVFIFWPEWDIYGKRAGFERNKLIIDRAEFVLIFWDGKSKGTQNDIILARWWNKPHILYIWNGEDWVIDG